MSERGWLRQVLSDAKADVNSWPEWMRNSSWDSNPTRLQNDGPPEPADTPIISKQAPQKGDE